MPFHLGPAELVIALVIVLVVFGAGRLPEAGGALGRAIRQFRQEHGGDPGDDRSTTAS